MQEDRINSGAAARATNTRFDGVSIAIHWLSLLLIALLFATAWSRALAENAATAGALLSVHRAAGIVLWLLTAARLGWRFTAGARPQLIAALPAAQRIAARTAEIALYALMLAQPLLGLGHSLLRGKPFDILVATIPALLPRDQAAAHILHELHEESAWLLLALIGLHAAAALIHRFVLRDGILQSMLPQSLGRRGNKSAPAPVLLSEPEGEAA